MTMYNPDHHQDKMDKAMQIMSEQSYEALMHTCKIERHGSIDGTAARRCLIGRGVPAQKVHECFLYGDERSTENDK